MKAYILTYINNLLADFSTETNIAHYTTNNNVFGTYVTEYNVKFNDLTAFNKKYDLALNLMKLALRDPHSSTTISTDTSNEDLCFNIVFDYTKNCKFYKIICTVMYEFGEIDNEDDE